MTTARELLRQEIELVWSIDRIEVIEAVYTFESGTLMLRPEHSGDVKLPKNPIRTCSSLSPRTFTLNVMSRATCPPN